SQRIFRRCGQWNDAQERKAAFAFEQNNMRAEGFRGRKHDFGTIGEHLLPVRTLRITDRRSHETERASAGVRADQKYVSGTRIVSADGKIWMMLDVVFVRILARRNQAKIAIRISCGKKTHFAGCVTSHKKQQIGGAAGAL